MLMTNEQRVQAAYVAKHLLGWRRLTATAWVTKVGSIGEVSWLLTGDGMLAILEALLIKARSVSIRVTPKRATVEVDLGYTTHQDTGKRGGHSADLPAAVLAAAYQALQAEVKE
jgi:hypothetical protein